ncbi:Zinc finger protein ZAT10 [Apostasia shenzhenica]|uniref:Zinc finger protein ZAT10 n=1 Tax=Apostasia shenzhenica TaxID=1088818 RepID=A0A2I0AFF4_9ASPA|nr:Zinc finger protein ZAT10 [Apostasia shenzhenica]
MLVNTSKQQPRIPSQLTAAVEKMIPPLIRMPSPAGSSDESSNLQIEKGSKRKRSEHKCSLCDAGSPSHKRYLGGRKTSHRKALSQSAAGASTAIGSQRIYQCSICLKGFPTGQALGGHMSHHCDFGGTSFIAGSSTMPATSLLASTEFELNIPPVPEASFESVGRCGLLKKEDRILKALPYKKRFSIKFLASA